MLPYIIVALALPIAALAVVAWRRTVRQVETAARPSPPCVCADCRRHRALRLGATEHMRPWEPPPCPCARCVLHARRGAPPPAVIPLERLLDAPPTHRAPAPDAPPPFPFCAPLTPAGARHMAESLAALQHPLNAALRAYCAEPAGERFVYHNARFDYPHDPTKKP